VDLAAPALQLKRILVCTDFSDVSAPAIDEAHRLSQRHGAELIILSVLEHDDLSEWPDAEKELALLGHERRKNLAAMVKKLSTLQIAARSIFLDGHPITVILRAIEDEAPDLVVVGTHGRRGFHRLILGSTAEAIIRNAQCPVMTVGPGFAPPSPGVVEGPIVFATDFRPGAEESMAYAAFLSQSHQVPLHCLHVLPKSSIQTKNHIVATIMETALIDLQRACGRDAVQPSCQAIVSKDVSKAIVEYARDAHASAIVVAVTKRAGMASHLPVRRTSRLVILSHCPVFTLAHEKHVSPLLRSTVL
jgi:nucleotide-binding universal stress UspA family protein